LDALWLGWVNDKNKLAKIYVTLVGWRAALARHRSEQYFTSSQFFSHFLRHAIGRPQATQGFSGKNDLLPANDFFMLNFASLLHLYFIGHM